MRMITRTSSSLILLIPARIRRQPWAVPAILCSPRPKIVLLLLLVAARGTWDGRHPQEAESRVIGGVDQFGSPSAIHTASRFS